MSANQIRVILADDEFHLRAFIAALLKKMNYTVVAQATNGQEAVALYRQHKPDLIMLDINMPVKNGEEALKEIRAEFPAARVIMLTSVVDEQQVASCLAAGAANYIRKDSPAAEIQALIAATLQAQ